MNCTGVCLRLTPTCSHCSKDQCCHDDWISIGLKVGTLTGIAVGVNQNRVSRFLGLACVESVLRPVCCLIGDFQRVHQSFRTEATVYCGRQHVRWEQNQTVKAKRLISFGYICRRSRVAVYQTADLSLTADVFNSTVYIWHREGTLLSEAPTQMAESVKSRAFSTESTFGVHDGYNTGSRLNVHDHDWLFFCKWLMCQDFNSPCPL